MRRAIFSSIFLAALAWAQLRSLSARLELSTPARMPARVYLFKDGRPFRLSPVDAMLPLRVDSFYRERIWRRSSDPATLEVTCNDISHFFLLKGQAGFDLPAGKYRVEAYRGHFYKPAVEEFELKAGETRPVLLKLENWAGDEAKEWVSSDDHIHLVRDREDDALFLSWMEAEDLSVGNFLQLQRQMDAGWQYGFGPKAEARRAGMSIRSGHESRSEFFGHVNLLGGAEMIRPLSVGSMYSNSPETFPYPFALFAMGRKVGATVGYAHFDGSMKHSALLMDVALGSLDFVEVFQFGRLKTEQWYQLLNAGFRVTGVAGSDFPVALNNWTREKTWSRWMPLLGPERLMVRVKPGASAYAAWASAVRKGDGVVTNGPMLSLRVEGGRAIADARFYRPLEKTEIVVNGKVIGSANGGHVEAAMPANGPLWAAARTSASEGIQAHTNPVYLRWDGTAVEPASRKALAERWKAEVDYYRSAPLVFPTPEERRLFFDRAENALKKLSTLE
ncbi:MAG TPA: CehA/McbA family metallohydrolase [Bryobacteraceae bacterium]|nr:CehA/McbA family metallohydrolase [Bryobacteraceae bacterium]